MNIKIRSLSWRVALAFIIALVFASAPPSMADEDGFPSIPSNAGQPPKTSQGQTLPFCLQDFVSFIRENFDLRPIEKGSDYAKFVFTERDGGKDVEIMRIMIRDRESYLQVAFSFKEFNIMHYVAEFMEGPFFTRAESEQLYALLYDRTREHSWRQVGRFRAKVSLVDGSDGIDALFEFAATTAVGQR